MAFSKSFPKKHPAGHTEWVDMLLTEEEENKVEASARQKNIKLMEESIVDAEKILGGSDKSDIIALAVALFEKRGSHVVFHKEEHAKKKFIDEHK